MKSLLSSNLSGNLAQILPGSQARRGCSESMRWKTVVPVLPAPTMIIGLLLSNTNKPLTFYSRNAPQANPSPQPCSSFSPNIQHRVGPHGLQLLSRQSQPPHQCPSHTEKVSLIDALANDQHRRIFVHRPGGTFCCDGVLEIATTTPPLGGQVCVF